MNGERSTITINRGLHLSGTNEESSSMDIDPKENRAIALTWRIRLEVADVSSQPVDPRIFH